MIIITKFGLKIQQKLSSYLAQAPKIIWGQTFLIFLLKNSKFVLTQNLIWIKKRPPPPSQEKEKMSPPLDFVVSLFEFVMPPRFQHWLK